MIRTLFRLSLIILISLLGTYTWSQQSPEVVVERNVAMTTSDGVILRASGVIDCSFPLRTRLRSSLGWRVVRDHSGWRANCRRLAPNPQPQQISLVVFTSCPELQMV